MKIISNLVLYYLPAAPKYANHQAYGHGRAARPVGIQTFEPVFKPVPVDTVGEQSQFVLRVYQV
jgi:hypothetical protein